MSAVKYWVWLSGRNGLGSTGALRLLDRFGSARDVYFAADAQYKEIDGITRRALESLTDKDMTATEKIMAECAEKDIRIITYQDSQYPERLKNIYDPPLLLYVKGNLPEMDEYPAVAMVGKRKCTPYGLVAAERLAAEITEHGGIVVSGMAEGIDSAAHRGALKAGGTTVAVLGCGVDVVYPAFNTQLYEDISAVGAVISEYAPGTQPGRTTFPARNRIISGLSVAAVVVEADVKSGALITANHALEQGREVFAVPGNVGVDSSAGCLKLIREGAGIAETGWDVLREFYPLFQDKITPHPRRKGGLQSRKIEYTQTQTLPETKAPLPAKALIDTSLMSEEEKKIVETLKDSELHVDDIIERTQISAANVLACLTVLEIGGTVEQLGGKKFRLRERALSPEERYGKK